jgi:branched-subunit amino acid ABC-type transport system permease component
MAFGMACFSGVCCLIVAASTSDGPSELAVLLSALIATSNGLCTLWLSHLGSKGGSMKAFFGAVFGGMVLRMGTTLAGLLIGIKVLLLPALPFAAALLSFTGVFTAAEVTLWSRQNFSPRVQHS